jgi:hypothetical protein
MCIEGVSNTGCRPFKDTCLMTAQILSIIAIALSFFSGWWWVMLFFGLPSFIMLQVAWCCAMNKCGFVTAGVLGLVGAGITLVFAILAIIVISSCDGYSSYSYDDYYGYSSYNYDADCILYDESLYWTWTILSCIGCFLWMAVGIMTLCFACGERYEQAERTLKEENPTPAPGNESTPVVATKSAVPVAAPQPAVEATPAPPSTSTTITHMPDGSVEKKTEVTNPDGSKTVTVTIERPE